jgi:4-amino-4-deoxy-L-arabinose transferase-like glycosyltransferase
MFNAIRRWCQAHPRWTLTLLAIALLGPFLAKPFHIDDPLFFWLARQVRAHPGDPFGFFVNWYGEPWPMWTVTENPPAAGYFYALAGSVFGWNEVGLHLGGLLAAVAAVLGIHRLAGRLCPRPLLAACVVLFTPIFLVSATTIMCDVLMLAFWVWAVVFWLEGIEEDRLGKLMFAGALMALALLTKYFGVALVPLLAVHGLIQKRRLGTWAAGLLPPLAALGAYQWATLALYHHPLFSAAAGYASTVQGELGFSKLSAGLIALAFTGGGAASAFFLAPALWRPRTLAGILGGTVVLGGLLVACGPFWQQFPALTTTAARSAVGQQMLFWAVGGVLVMALVAADLWQHPRDAQSWLLALWVAGTFGFAAFLNWTVNGRSLLPLLPAVGILLARRHAAGGDKYPAMVALGLAASALLALLVAQADFQLAATARQSAQAAAASCRQSRGTVWFEGHWGFQYYMEQLGAQPVDLKHPRQAPGDMLVIPQHNTDVFSPAREVVSHREVLSLPNPSWLATWTAGDGAGFYSSVVGPLPFGFGRVPPEVVYVFELEAPLMPRISSP